MTIKDLLKIREFLYTYREDKALAKSPEDIKEIDRLIQIINDEAINSNFKCDDGKVYFS